MSLVIILSTPCEIVTIQKSANPLAAKSYIHVMTGAQSAGAAPPKQQSPRCHPDLGGDTPCEYWLHRGKTPSRRWTANSPHDPLLRD